MGKTLKAREELVSDYPKEDITGVSFVGNLFFVFAHHRLVFMGLLSSLEYEWDMKYKTGGRKESVYWFDYQLH